MDKFLISLSEIESLVPAIESLIRKALLIIGLLSLAGSLAIFFIPNLFSRFNKTMKIWLSTRKLLRLLEIPIDIDGWIFAHRWLIGSILFILSLVIIIRVLFFW